MTDSEETIYVPHKKKANFLMVFLLMLAGIFLTIGIASLTTIVSLIRALIMEFMMALTGWDTVLASLFVMVVAFFLATVLYLIARRGLEIVRKIEDTLRLNVTNEPTEYYELGIIETEELVNEFKKRNCTITAKENKGFVIDCEEAPLTKRVLGVINEDFYTLNNAQKIGVVAVIIVLWSVFIGAIIMDAIDDSFVWIVAISIFAFSSLLLVGVRIIKLWHTVILWTILNTFFTLFSGEDPVVIWSLWGALAIFVVLVAIAYLLKQPACQLEDRWYCELL